MIMIFWEVENKLSSLEEKLSQAAPIYGEENVVLSTKVI